MKCITSAQLGEPLLTKLLFIPVEQIQFGHKQLSVPLDWCIAFAEWPFHNSNLKLKTLYVICM